MKCILAIQLTALTLFLPFSFFWGNDTRWDRRNYFAFKKCIHFVNVYVVYFSMDYCKV